MRGLAAMVLVVAAFALCEPAAAQEESGTVGASVFVDPLRATLRIQPSRIQQGNTATIRVTISNDGPAPLGSVTAGLLIDPEGVAIAGAPTFVLAGLPAASSESIEWRACGATPGSYLAMVVVTSGDAAGHAFRAETSAVLLQVDPRKGRPKSC